MNRRKRILFIVPHRIGRSPGQRFRFEQYLDALKESGYDVTISNLLDERDDLHFYSKARYFQKGIIVLKSLWKRYSDMLKAGEFDIVFIYREAIMLGFTWFEENIARSGAKLILDFDDAIWLKDVSEGNRNIAFLKKPEKTFKLISLADLVIAGNDFIAEKCSEYCDNVEVFPTTIDMDYHVPKKERHSDKIVIGWTGTETTLKHLETAMPVFEEVYKRYKDKVTFRIICDKEVHFPQISSEWVGWSIKDEISQLNKFDIGIMPLPDNEWTKAKCGFKVLQYMALEIPCVASPVGVNSQIIVNEEDGFLANSDDEWFNCLEKMILSEELRNAIGSRARNKVSNKYSKQALVRRYIQLIDSCCVPSGIYRAG